MRPVTLTKLLRAREAIESTLFLAPHNGTLEPRLHVSPHAVLRYRAICRAICDMVDTHDEDKRLRKGEPWRPH